MKSLFEYDPTTESPAYQESAPHVLVVPADPSHFMEVEHPSTCKPVKFNPDTECDVEFECDVSSQIHDEGLDSYFRHSAAPIREFDSGVVVVAPGRHRIVAWFQRIEGHEFTEYDGGLKLVAPV